MIVEIRQTENTFDIKLTEMCSSVPTRFFKDRRNFVSKDGFVLMRGNDRLQVHTRIANVTFPDDTSSKAWNTESIDKSGRSMFFLEGFFKAVKEFNEASEEKNRIKITYFDGGFEDFSCIDVFELL